MKTLRLIWQIICFIWYTAICLIPVALVLMIIAVPFYVIYRLFFYEPEPLTEADLNPIRNPQSSPYQIESKGIRSIKQTGANNHPRWQRIIDSKGLCYTVAYDSVDGSGWFESANHMRFFEYQFHQPENNIPQSQVGLRIHYLRGTVHKSYWSSIEPTLENICLCFQSDTGCFVDF